MRSMFGLVGLLITIAVIVWLLAAVILPYDKQVITSGNKAKAQVSQIAGIDEQGNRAMNSLTLVTEDSGGKLKDLLVTSVQPSGAFATYYGLQRNDTIVQIGNHGSMYKVSDINDAEMAKAWVYEAYQYQQPLVVIRNGETITLTGNANAATPQPAVQPQSGAGQAAAPSAPEKPADPVAEQLNAIKKIPLH